MVDDDDVIANLYANKFRGAGYEVVIAHNVVEMGQQFVSGLVPDLALLDVVMPMTNGIEAVTMVMDTPSLNNMKIIIFSNFDYHANLSPQIAKRISAYCVKVDSTPSQILKLIQGLI